MSFTALRGLEAPADGGITLATDLYRPDGEPGRWPTVLFRTPYGRDAGQPLGELARWIEGGYAVVTQDVRGTGGSGGRFRPFEQEAADGAATIRWIAAQSWSDGSVVMAGPSYLGATQWQAAMAAPPALRAIAPQLTTSTYHEGWCYRGGALQLGFLWCWALATLALPAAVGRDGPSAPSVTAVRDAVDDLATLYGQVPFGGLELLDDLVPDVRTWLERRSDEAYWSRTAPRSHRHEVVVPSLNVGGWFDCFLAGTIENYASSPPGSRLLIGPWSHGLLGGEFPERSFGSRASAAAAGLPARQLAFFDEVLGRRARGPGDHPVTLFLMGDDRWVDAPGWPVPGASERRLHFEAGGGLRADGPPPVDGTDAYVHDPRDPVPSWGGATYLPGYLVGANGGPRDQRAVEARADVLSYTTPVLEEEIVAVGPVRVELHASSTAVDTDFCATLVDVHPDGRALLVTDGVVRARFRSSLWISEPLDPGAVHRFVLDLVATATVFAPGHRIRVDVASSDFPRYDRNPGTGDDGHELTLAEHLVVENRVWTGPAHPSHISLAVVDRPMLHGA